MCKRAGQARATIDCFTGETTIHPRYLAITPLPMFEIINATFIALPALL